MLRMLPILDLERLDESTFRGTTPVTSITRVFGGQVAAQALVAAGRTVPEDRPVHSLHAYFLRPGDPSQPIVYEVDPIRDGGSFTTRRVVAIQNGEAIFNLSASFQRLRTGGFAHQLPKLTVPDPDTLPSVDEAMSQFAPRTQAWLEMMKERHPIEMRFVVAPARDSVARGNRPAPREQVWLRSAEPLPDDPLMHACTATFTSDMVLLGSALPPHGLSYGDPGLVAVSLDHAVWFHQPFRADEWYLYETAGEWAGGGRALCQGRMFDQSGQLLASVVQEGLLSYRAPGLPHPSSN